MILNDGLELNPAAKETHPIEIKNEIRSKIESRRNDGCGKR